MNPVPKTAAKDENLLDSDCARLLEAEIEFWQELIATAPANHSPQSLERMHQALALAEAKFMSLLAASGSNITPVTRAHRRWRQ